MGLPLLLEDAPRWLFLVVPLAVLAGMALTRETREGAIRRYQQGWGGRLALLGLLVLLLIPLSIWFFDPR